MPTFGSLFAGIGGIDLGLERAGWECRFQVEWSEWCQHNLAHHWPDVPRYGDITAVDWSGVERVDLLAGGFPCQPVSLVGQQRAQDDARWLWPEFARAIREVRPRLALMENVPGLLVHGLGSVLGDLAAIGYDTEWDCLPAGAFGAPHIRDRVWIVAYPDRSLSAEQRGAMGWSQPGPRSLVADTDRDDGEGLRSWSDASQDRQEPVAGPLGLFRGAGSDRGWEAEPPVGRVAHGVPARVDRLRALGNAVVPQVPEWIGRRLMEALS